MKSVSISGSIRENVGKKDAKAQRRNGLIPCVLYGGKEQKQLLVEETAFEKLIYTPEVQYVELDVNGNQCNAILQEVQFHPVTEKILHVDFLEVSDNKKVTIAIPVKTKGNSPGVMRGGKLSKRFRKLKVNGLLKDIPENITIDISNLDILDSVKVEDIQIDNIAIVEHPANVVLTILTSRNVEEAPTES
jgi:large subunit ribosomal protein L25